MGLFRAFASAAFLMGIAASARAALPVDCPSDVFGKIIPPMPRALVRNPEALVKANELEEGGIKVLPGQKLPPWPKNETTNVIITKDHTVYMMLAYDKRVQGPRFVGSHRALLNTFPELNEPGVIGFSGEIRDLNGYVARFSNQSDTLHGGAEHLTWGEAVLVQDHSVEFLPQTRRVDVTDPLERAKGHTKRASVAGQRRASLPNDVRTSVEQAFETLHQLFPPDLAKGGKPWDFDMAAFETAVVQAKVPDQIIDHAYEYLQMTDQNLDMTIAPLADINPEKVALDAKALADGVETLKSWVALTKKP